MTDKYKIEDMMEQNQRFVSYKVFDSLSGNKLLLKRYLIDASSGLGRISKWQSAFMTIIEELSQVNSPNLRTLFEGELDKVDGNPFAVFEWLEFNSAESLLEMSSLNLELVVEMISSALSALDVIHNKGIVHANITPKSILYTDSVTKSPWVLDWDPVNSLRCKFGVNRFHSDYYTAPELLSGAYATPQSDIYAVGQTALKALGDTQLNPAISNWLHNLTFEEPEKRFPTAEVALSELKKIDLNQPQLITSPIQLKSPVVSAPVAPAIETRKTNLSSPPIKNAPPVAAPPKKSNKAVLGAIAALLVIGGLVTFFLLPKNDPDNKQSNIAGNSTDDQSAHSLIHPNASTPVLQSTDYAIAAKYKGQIVIVEGFVRNVVHSTNYKRKYELLCSSADKKEIDIIGNINSAFKTSKIPQLQTHYNNSHVSALGRLIFSNGKYFVDIEDQGSVRRKVYDLVRKTITVMSHPDSQIISIDDPEKLKLHVGKVVTVMVNPEWATFNESKTAYRLICNANNNSFFLEGKVDKFFNNQDLLSVSNSYVGRSFSTAGRLQYRDGCYILDLDDEELKPSETESSIAQMDNNLKKIKHLLGKKVHIIGTTKDLKPSKDNIISLSRNNSNTEIKISYSFKPQYVASLQHKKLSAVGVLSENKKSKSLYIDIKNKDNIVILKDNSP